MKALIQSLVRRINTFLFGWCVLDTRRYYTWSRTDGRVVSYEVPVLVQRPFSRDELYRIATHLAGVMRRIDNPTRVRIEFYDHSQYVELDIPPLGFCVWDRYASGKRNIDSMQLRDKDWARRPSPEDVQNWVEWRDMTLMIDDEQEAYRHIARVRQTPVEQMQESVRRAMFWPYADNH